MIKKIYVNGFRSLIDFDLEINPGLNILVGPNGSGKTNIISFFEFLSYLVESGASEAVNKLGGAGSVFSKRTGKEEDFEHLLTAKISGYSGLKANKINYEYEFVISSTTDFSNIYFESQTVKFNIGSINEVFEENSKTIIVKQEHDKNSVKNNYSTVNIEKKNISSPFFDMIWRENKKGKNKEAINSFFELFTEYEDSILTMLVYLFEETRIIPSDLRSGAVFNIIPSKVKAPEETSMKIGIQRDGSGLAATLYAIQNKKESIDVEKMSNRLFFRKRPMEYDLKKITIKTVVKYLKIANGSIDNVQVHNDRFENLLKIKFYVHKADASIILPATAMSDGTIKWLSFVTAILISPNVFSIEEPENYLHPLMQKEVINLLRESSNPENGTKAILMSTHSETVLNNASPKELIIVEYKDGKTYAKRCSNGEDLSTEIKNTGFGLGYYYLTGSVENE